MNGTIVYHLPDGSDEIKEISAKLTGGDVVTLLAFTRRKGETKNGFKQDRVDR
jgi:hypothetical protein